MPASPMNRGGNAKTLIAAHPGNRNAEKAGVYSARARAARAAEIVDETATVAAGDLHTAVLRRELSSLLALSEAQDRAIAEDGVAGRRGQPRVLVDQRLRTHEKLLRLLRELQDVETPEAGVTPQLPEAAPDLLPT
ncbi:MAG: hypothetical protein ACRDQZ_04835, partial [Mycobacteriales bacterium]